MKFIEQDIMFTEAQWEKAYKTFTDYLVDNKNSQDCLPTVVSPSDSFMIMLQILMDMKKAIGQSDAQAYGLYLLEMANACLLSIASAYAVSEGKKMCKLEDVEKFEALLGG